MLAPRAPPGSALHEGNSEPTRVGTEEEIAKENVRGWMQVIAAKSLNLL